eukprot:scaffold81772_cov49-Phaeocystis_antarctica.AAC.3
MPPMFVTLEVSKLSGWLNADARCRESKGGHTVRARLRASRRGRRATTALGSTAGRAGHGEERT